MYSLLLFVIFKKTFLETIFSIVLNSQIKMKIFQYLNQSYILYSECVKEQFHHAIPKYLIVSGIIPIPILKIPNYLVGSQMKFFFVIYHKSFLTDQNSILS